MLAFPWKVDGHINELELNTVAVFLKRRSRARNCHKLRFMHVLDSMVTRGCLAKGSSSSKLGFTPDSYTPYCLRWGGATWHFQSSLSLDATVARGSWSCSRTARAYIDEGTAQLAHVSWTSKQRQLILKWSCHLLEMWLRQAPGEELEANIFFLAKWRG